MKNNKGFTLIEMLGTVVILGIIGTIAVTAVTKYLVSSRKEAYKMLQDALYEAVSNCASESNCNLSNDTTMTVSDLKNKGYLDSFKNPKNSSKECDGSVVVKIVESSGSGKIKNYSSSNCSDGPNCINGNSKVEVDEANTKYFYKVIVNCDGFDSTPRYYPNGTTEEEWSK